MHCYKPRYSEELSFALQQKINALEFRGENPVNPRDSTMDALLKNAEAESYATLAWSKKHVSLYLV